MLIDYDNCQKLDLFDEGNLQVIFQNLSYDEEFNANFANVRLLFTHLRTSCGAQTVLADLLNLENLVPRKKAPSSPTTNI